MTEVYWQVYGYMQDIFWEKNMHNFTGSAWQNISESLKEKLPYLCLPHYLLFFKRGIVLLILSKSGQDKEDDGAVISLFFFSPQNEDDSLHLKEW